MTWQVHPEDSKILAIHAALLANGKLLLFGGDQHRGDVSNIDNTRIFDPDSGPPTEIDSPTTDVFCSGHAFLGDGRLLVAGGTEEWGTGDDPHHQHGLNFGGERACWLYLPRENVWRPVADLHFEPGRPTGGGRWYPTLVTLGNGEVCAFSGHPSRRTPSGVPSQTPPGDSRHQNDTPERYSPGGNFWTILPAGVWTGTVNGTGFYPRVHLLRNGNIYIGTPVSGKYHLYDPFAGAFIGPEIDAAGGLYDSWDAASVLLPLLPQENYRPRILVAGDAAPKRLDLGPLTEPGGSATAPSWQPAGTRPNGEARSRRFGMGVILPTGKVLLCGGVYQVGSAPPDPTTPELAIPEAEVYMPPIDWVTGTYDSVAPGIWEFTPPAAVIRNYHSVALLLPDGRVWTGGSSKKAKAGNPDDVNIAEKRMEIYSPPYVGQPRPTLSSAPAFIHYGDSFTITSPEAATIQRVALIRCGSFTHAFDSDQRYVGLLFEPGPAAGTLTVIAPPNGNVAPPGEYMLWIVDQAGNPCHRAAILRLTPARSFILSDRSSFSVHEVEALGLPATFDTSLYFVLEGLLPGEVASLPPSPVLSFHLDARNGPVTNAITATAAATPMWEVPSQPPDIPQRATWGCTVHFHDTSLFAALDSRDVWVRVELGPFAAEARLRLTKQPNPYMLDGPVEWLSTDIRAFRVRPGETPYGVTFEASDTPYTFLQRQLPHFNSPAGAGTFTAIPENPDDSPLSLARSDSNGTPIYNFAFARVRYRALALSAADVRVFFRLFNTVGTAFEFQSASTGAYRRAGDGAAARPLLGLQGNTIVSIPFFSEPRVTPGGDMSGQPDNLNVKRLDPAGANEFVWHYGVYLDINQPDRHFPRNPNNDGPFDPEECTTVQQLLADLHHCLVCEVYFDPPDPMAPDLVQFGDTPGSSDKIAQRNLAFVQCANPGSAATRTIQHTFEVRPSSSKSVSFASPFSGVFTHGLHRMTPDELIFRWGGLPPDSLVTLYLPSIDAVDILRIASTRPGPATLEILDANTIRCAVGDIAWVPLPGGRDVNLAGLLTIELPPGVVHGQTFRVIAQQYSGLTQQVIGTFQLTISVTHDDLLPRELQRLSLLRYIFEGMPATDRWHPVFLRYLAQVADRVTGFGGNPDIVAPSPHGNGQLTEEAKCRCRWQWLVSLVVGVGLAVLGAAPAAWTAPLVALFFVAVVAGYCFWRRDCRPGACDVIHAGLLGTTIGAGALSTSALLGIPTRLAVLAVASLASALLAAVAVLHGCWGPCWCARPDVPRPWWQRALPFVRMLPPSDISTKQQPRDLTRLPQKPPAVLVAAVRPVEREDKNGSG